MMKFYYKAIGLLSLGLGIVGAFLPLLPTTCFVLLSAWCFAKSSPVWHQRLRNNRLLGPAIVQWEENHCMPKKAKFIALGSLLFFGTLSFLFIEDSFLRVVLVSLLFAGMVSIQYFSRSSRCLA